MIINVAGCQNRPKPNKRADKIKSTRWFMISILLIMTRHARAECIHHAVKNMKLKA